MVLNVTFSEEQVKALCAACKTLIRVHIGDFGEIADTPALDDEIDREMLREKLISLSPIVTGQRRGNFRSISSKYVKEEARTADGLYQTLMNLLNTP